MKMSNLATKSHFFLSGNNVEVFLPVKETQEIPPEAIFFEVCKEKLEVLTLYSCTSPQITEKHDFFETAGHPHASTCARSASREKSTGVCPTHQAPAHSSQRAPHSSHALFFGAP